MFEKNKSGNPLGRPQGSKGKAPQALKEVIEGIIAEVFTQEQITLDLLKCEPRERLSLLIKLCEFCVPKMRSIDATIEREGRQFQVVFKDCSGNVVDSY